MRKVIAAVDNSAAARAVLAAAGNLAQLFDAQVVALHVGEDGDRTARAAAAAAGLELRTVQGPTVPTLVEAAADPDVVLVVVGARRLAKGARPIGATALDVITSLLKPVVVVPPHALSGPELRRVLVPLEGTISTSLAPKGIIEFAHDAELDVTVLHVHDAATLPFFTDQPQHQVRAWGDEFVARYCPWGIGKVTVELRVGRPAEEILAVAAETGAQLIALGWSQEIDWGRAPVVREVLERGRTPVLLVPVRLIGREQSLQEESWSRSQSQPD
jgi:nucleotide-binding universal stress UspA family protein